MAKRHTKKKHGSSKSHTRRAHVMTIPQLRAAFEKVNKEARKLIASASPEAAAPKFQKLWTATFHKSITSPAAKSYLIMLSGSRKQHGGAMGMDGISESSPAGLSDMLRPGIYATPTLPPTPQGAFYQSYVGNPGYPGSSMPEPGFGGPAGCAKQAGGRHRAKRSVSQGLTVKKQSRREKSRRRTHRTRKMRGGAYLPSPADFVSSYSSHPYVSQNPQTAIADMSRMWNGQAIAPPKDVTRSDPPYITANPSVGSLSSVAPFTRSLWSDISSR